MKAEGSRQNPSGRGPILPRMPQMAAISIETTTVFMRVRIRGRRLDAQ